MHQWFVPTASSIQHYVHQPRADAPPYQQQFGATEVPKPISTVFPNQHGDSESTEWTRAHVFRESSSSPTASPVSGAAAHAAGWQPQQPTGAARGPLHAPVQHPISARGTSCTGACTNGHVCLSERCDQPSNDDFLFSSTTRKPVSKRGESAQPNPAGRPVPFQYSKW